MPIEPSRYGNIWASDHPDGSPEALEAFSSLVDDDLPTLAPLFAPSGISLPQVYALILQAGAPSGPLNNAFASAQEKFATVSRGSLENPGTSYHPSWPSPIGWCDPGNDGLWTKVTIAPNQPPPPPAPHVSPALMSFLREPALAQLRVMAAPRPAPQPIHGPDIPLMLRANVASLRPSVGLPPQAKIVANQKLFAKVSVEAAASVKSPVMMSALAGKRGIMAQMTPAVASNLARLHPVALGDGTVHLRTGFHKVIGTPHFPADFPIGGVTGIAEPAPPPPPPPPPAAPPSSTTVTATQVGLTFEYIQVSLRRPWLETTLMRLPSWSVQGLPQSSISNGHSDVNPGMMPLIPNAFVAIRNVSINGQWSASDRASIQSALSGGGVASLGPFALAAGGGALGGFNGSSLSLPGVCIIAWICSVTPNIPPT
jgi:hypothetical protein